jgi:DtxR family Mn-dependent transcriptional regulator
MAILGNPTTCPHGNPFPGLPRPATVLLATLRQGDEREIDGVEEEAEEDSDLMRFLEQNRMVPGALIRVVEVADYNSTMTVEVNGERVVLGKPAAENLRVLKPVGNRAEARG